MGQKELIDSLHKEADRKISLLWKTVKTDAEIIRSKTEQQIERLRANFNIIESRAVKRDSAAVTERAERDSRAIVLSTEKELSERLRKLASSCLHELRGHEYGSIFSVLCSELPAAEWKTVRVNPADIDIAELSFPEADIIPDENITGGMTVFLENDEVRVSNTFEKRLERTWEEIAPLIIKEIYRNI